MSAPPRSDSLDVIEQIAAILNVGLDRASLKALVDLVEAGVSPEAIVAVVEEVRRGHNETHNTWCHMWCHLAKAKPQRSVFVHAISKGRAPPVL